MKYRFTSFFVGETGSMAGGTQAQVLDCSFILCVGFIIALFPFQLPPLSFWKCWKQTNIGHQLTKRIKKKGRFLLFELCWNFVALFFFFFFFDKLFFLKIVPFVSMKRCRLALKRRSDAGRRWWTARTATTRRWRTARRPRRHHRRHPRHRRPKRRRQRRRFRPIGCTWDTAPLFNRFATAASHLAAVNPTATLVSCITHKNHLERSFKHPKEPHITSSSSGTLNNSPLSPPSL